MRDSAGLCPKASSMVVPALCIPKDGETSWSSNPISCTSFPFLLLPSLGTYIMPIAQSSHILKPFDLQPALEAAKHGAGCGRRKREEVQGCVVSGLVPW